MNGFSVIAENIIVLGLAMLIGFICVKTGYIPKETKDALSKIIVKVTLPVLVMTSLTKLELNGEKVINSVITAVSGLIIVGIMFLIGIIIARLFKMERPRAVMHACMSAFGNTVFVAYPLIQALYGDEGLLYAALFVFANDCYLWTLGVYKMSEVSAEKSSPGKNIKHLINPATIAFGISFIMMIFKLQFGGPIKTVLTGIGSTTTYLSMFFIGGTLASVKFKDIYKRVPLFVIVAVKMLIIPFILIAFLKLFNINDTVRAVLVLQAAMPVSTVVSILASEYKCDTIYSAEGVFITTVLSLITIPVVYTVMNVF